MEALGDPRARVPSSTGSRTIPAGTAMADELLRAVGRFRRPEVADRLLVLWEKDAKRREAVFNALVTISGYDQRIEDPEDERPDDRLAREAVPAPRRRARPVDGPGLGAGRRQIRWPG